jgi:hypothetical protein
MGFFENFAGFYQRKNGFRTLKWRTLYPKNRIEDPSSGEHGKSLLGLLGVDVASSEAS